jgi:CRP-like cAMP-binding protein
MDGSSPLVAKLSHLVPLSDEDVRILDALCLNEERFAANNDIVHEGDVPRSAFVLTHGMAFRYRLMPDGKRQILTFMIPGDIFGLHAFLLTATDHSIGTLMPTRVATISRDTVFDLFDQRAPPQCGTNSRVIGNRMRSSASASSRSDGEVHEGALPTCCAS